MKKILLSALLAGLLSISLVACGSGNSDSTTDPNTSTTPTETTTEKEVAPVLVGDWEQSNKTSEDNYQTAVITDDSIEVYWVSPDSKSLYWAGTFECPADESKHTFDSVNDVEKTSAAMLASGAETKTFTYEDGILSYEVTAMGMTQTVKLELLK